MFLLKKIKQIINKSISTNKNNSNDKDNFQENDLLNITFEENIVKIEIKEECTLKEYSDNIDEFDDKIKNLDIPIGILIFFDEHNISKSKLKQQTIFIFSNNSINYIITISNNITKISERRNENNEINETVFEPKFDEKEYKILKYIHDLNRSTKVVKWYPENNSNYKYFTLDKKEALSLAQNLLDNLETIKNMDNILRYPHYIYNLLNLISNKHYNPVISDAVLTLSCPYKYEENNINKRNYENLDIILNETSEKIGNISFDYVCSSGFSYGGNVSYNIKKEFRNNHYATRSL